MSKHGTNRGGRRVRAGDKPQALADKITKGKAATILEIPELQPGSLLDVGDLNGGVELNGEDMPAPSDYLGEPDDIQRKMGQEISCHHPV